MNSLRALEIKSKVDFDKHHDVLKDYSRVELIRVGCILDALDDYGTWYLGIVIDEKSWPNGEERKIHFLPYHNSNRDEEFKDADSARIAPAFTQTEIPSDPE